MGTEYTSENFGQITELGVTIQNLPAYRPELKGQVEKFFDLIQSEYKKHLKGRGVIEPDYRERGAHDYRKDACLTMRDFETVILRCILYYNSQRILENFPYTEEMLQEGVQPFAEDNGKIYAVRVKGKRNALPCRRIYREIFKGRRGCGRIQSGGCEPCMAA